jgi:hypothetical protein
MTAAPALPFPARASDPQTSHQAAALDRVTLRARVSHALTQNAIWAPEDGGLTDWEITHILRLPDRRKPSVAKRRQELGCVDTGTRRPSPDGRPTIVWRLP